jgi:hypothetical protein
MGHPPVLHVIVELTDSTMNPINSAGAVTPPELIKKKKKKKKKKREPHPIPP